jgi:hypothetical protein
MPAFLSYLNCITNHSLKNLLNLFHRLSSRSPPPDFPPSRHRAVSSSFFAELPVPFPFPPALPSRRITIVSRSAPSACPAVIVGAAHVSPLFFPHILFKFILFLTSNSPACLFKLLSYCATCSSCSPLPACTCGPAHDSPLPLLLVVHARSHRAARVTPRPPRPLLLAVLLHACCPCTPNWRATRYCAGPSPSRPLALAACALSPSIPAAINGEVPVLPVTLPCQPSPLSLSAYKSAPEPPLTPPTLP